MGTIPVFNVMDYGALGNGTHNDAPAIVSAIAASASGGSVFFPPGLYLVSSTITITNPVVIQGSGIGISNILIDSVNARGSDLFLVKSQEVSFFDFTFTTSNSSTVQTGGAFIHIQDQGTPIGFFTVRNFRIANCFKGIQISGQITNLYIENGFIGGATPSTGIGSIGVSIEYLNGHGGQDHFLRGLNIAGLHTSQPAAGIFIEGTGFATISDCDLTSCGACLAIYGGVIFVVNSSFDSSNYGIHITPNNPLTTSHFIGCLTTNHSVAGIMIEGAPSGTVNNIDFIDIHCMGYLGSGQSAPTNGIYIGKGSNIKISGCQVDTYGGTSGVGSGIFLDTPTTNCIVTENTIYDSRNVSNQYGIFISASSTGNFLVTNNLWKIPINNNLSLPTNLLQANNLKIT